MSFVCHPSSSFWRKRTTSSRLAQLRPLRIILAGAGARGGAPGVSRFVWRPWHGRARAGHGETPWGLCALSSRGRARRSGSFGAGRWATSGRVAARDGSARTVSGAAMRSSVTACSASSALSVRGAAPELGHRRAAIAQQRLRTSAAVAVADQRRGRRPPLALRRSSNSSNSMRSARARRQRGDQRRAARATSRKTPTGAKLLDKRRLEIGELGRILVRQHEIFSTPACRTPAQCSAERALPSSLFEPARPEHRSSDWPRHAHC